MEKGCIKHPGSSGCSISWQSLTNVSLSRNDKLLPQVSSQSVNMAGTLTSSTTEGNRQRSVGSSMGGETVHQYLYGLHFFTLVTDHQPLIVTALFCPE